MTPRTRRLAVVPLATMAALLPALPAVGSTSYMTGCTRAGDVSSASIQHEAPLSYDGQFTSVSVDPQAETLSASAGLSWNGTPEGDGCSVLADYRDTITVVGAGLPAGALVDVTAVVRLVGSVTATGSGTPLHSAEADADASFHLRERFAEFGTPDVLYVRGDARSHDQAVDGSPFEGSSFLHDIEVNGVPADSSHESDEVDGIRAFDIGTQTVTFSVPVGTVLEAVATVGPSAEVYDGEGAASAVVDEFSVKLTTSTPGAALDRGDGPAPEPEPEPTALESVQDARAALASYGAHKGITKALGSKLQHAERDIVAGADACDDLASFTAQVSAQRGKKLTAAQADELTAFAQHAQEQLGC